MKTVAAPHPHHAIIAKLVETFGKDAVEIEAASDDLGPSYDDICVRLPDIGRHQVTIEFRMTEENDPKIGRRYWMVAVDSTDYAAYAHGEIEEHCDIVEVPDLETAIAVAIFTARNIELALDLGR